MKTWNGDLSVLNEEESQLFKYFYSRFEYDFKFGITKKSIKDTVRNYKKSGWPKKVVDICEFMLLERYERRVRAQLQWEREQYRKLKRKFGIK